MAVNVWVQSVDSETFRADQISSVAARKLDRKGWCVVWPRPRAGDVVFAALGRGGRAEAGVRRLCHELSVAIAAGKKIKEGCTITCIKNGYPKGGAQWSTLAAPPPGIRRIPVVPPPDELRRGG